MTFKKYLAYLMATMMMASTLVACGNNAKGNSSVGNPQEADFNYDDDTPVKKEVSIQNETSTKETTDDSSAEDTTAPVSEEDNPSSETAVQAKDSQAFLAYTNGEEWIGYDGDPIGNPDHNQLAFGAGVADITGNGTYTVSLNADTDAFRHAVTDDDSEYFPSGVAFMAVVIQNGETLTPNAIITVDKVTVDGTDVELLAKNYTSTESGNIRSNIFNKYISTPSADARSTEGSLFDEDGNPIVDDAEAYSPNIIDASAVGEWKKMEVTFTVSGLEDVTAVSVDDADFSVDDENAQDDDSPLEDETSENADSSSEDGNADTPVIDGDGEEKADFVFE